jgi:hypothetical protein
MADNCLVCTLEAGWQAEAKGSKNDGVRATHVVNLVEDRKGTDVSSREDLCKNPEVEVRLQCQDMNINASNAASGLSAGRQ